MIFPLGLEDISFFLAFLSIMIFPMSYVVRRYYGPELTISRKLEATAIAVSVLFIFTIAARIYNIISNF